MSEGKRAEDNRLDQKQVGGDHYSKMKITPWQFLESCLTPDELRGYFKGEAIVYIARELSKAGPLDISKARHVLQKLEEVDTAIAASVALRVNDMEPSDFLDFINGKPAAKAHKPFFEGSWDTNAPGARPDITPCRLPCTTCIGQPCKRLDSCPYKDVDAALAGPVAPQTPAQGAQAAENPPHAPYWL